MMNRSLAITRARASEEGKSLVEIVIIVMIMAVVTAISVPAIANSIRSYNLRSAAARVTERLSGARTLAMAKNKNVTVAFATPGGSNVTQYGYDFSPVGSPDGTPDSSDPDDLTQSYYVEMPPSGITMSFTAGGNTLANGKGVTYTSRGELPIGASQADIRLSNSSMILTVSINLRGQVWVH